MDEPHPHIQVTFPFDSNIRYLPLVYLIPVDQIVRYPTLNTLPRCLSEIAVSKPMMDLLDSDAFLKDIMDAIAALTFPHFGFRTLALAGGKNTTPATVQFGGYPMRCPFGPV